MQYVLLFNGFVFRVIGHARQDKYRNVNGQLHRQAHQARYASAEPGAMKAVPGNRMLSDWVIQ